MNRQIDTPLTVYELFDRLMLSPPESHQGFLRTIHIDINNATNFDYTQEALMPLA